MKKTNQTPLPPKSHKKEIKTTAQKKTPKKPTKKTPTTVQAIGCCNSHIFKQTFAF